ncbi:hypothetical protein H9Y05_06795 [Crocinitomicaceae bacterium CZZ-1]|uniref:Uncharacterized protein n=1 Tax=Taishania pollutisoli TaxID=2766479 RepID=A0A8J6P5G6_9FLAO|nr:hypothetical protein [Taishania pollutisoli]MBC9812184.1 hypothetical protein [Taishania pollutisoli]
MKEVIAKEHDGKIVVLGYTSTKVSTADNPVQKTYKVLRLTYGDFEEKGDIHVFEFLNENWYLRADMSLVSLNNNNLIDLYQFIPRNAAITFDVFIDLLWDGIKLK